MTPAISVILPVYNVENYLRQSLDSVVGQTLQDLQIICVNDGSTDGSREILTEYAAKDTRIELIDQENSGGGSARNRAFPSIRGKYTYFADPDDWLRPDLCEKTFQLAEQTGADAVYFNVRNMSNGHQFKFDAALPAIRHSPREKKDLLSSFNSTWLKLWRSSFLVGHNVFFAEGKRPMNDVIQNWRGITQAETIAILDEPFYCRRVRPGSYQQSKDASHLVVVDAFREIEDMLVATEKYDIYQNDFLSLKVNAFRHVDRNIAPEFREELHAKIRNAFTRTEKERCEKVLSKTNRRFLRFVCGGVKERICYRFFETLKWPEKIVRKISGEFSGKAVSRETKKG